MNVNKMIKEKETQFMNWWNSKYNEKIEMETFEKSNNDFFSENYIIELKSREDLYSTKMIELYKLTSNYTKAQLSNKEFIYCVVDKGGVSIFNISKNIDDILKLKIENRKMEHTKRFQSKKVINKIHYNLPESLSAIWEQKI